MHRAEFIKKSCTACIGVVSWSALGALQGCVPSNLYRATVTGRKIIIPLTAFSEFSSLIVRAKGEPFDVIVLKNNEGVYDAFELRCTHADTSITYTGRDFICHLHGSVYSRNGQVTKGPAEENLRSFKIELSANEIVVLL